MTKIAFLLLVVGLAVGLWLGFDPQMHDRIVQTWHATQVFFTDLKTNIVAKFHHLASPLGAKAAPAPKSNSEWNRVSSDFGDLWKAVQRIWHDIGVSLHLIKA